MFSDNRRLRIGYYTDDEYLTPVPAMREGVMLAVNALRAAGHEVGGFYCVLSVSVVFLLCVISVCCVSIVCCQCLLCLLVCLLLQ